MTIPANFSAHNADPYINVQWWVAIDGLRYRYGTCLPSWNPTDTATNQTIKDYMSDMIQCRAQKVEPLNGKTTSHGLTISLLDVGDDVTELFSVHDNTNKAWTTVRTNCTASAATLNVVSTDGFTTPCELFVGGETMWATDAGADYFMVDRAKYGSIAQDHLLTDDAGITQTIEVWNAPRFIVGRGITLYECRDELAEADAIKMRCVIDSVSEKHGVWTISASGHLSKMASLINKRPAWREIRRVSNFMQAFGGEGSFVTATASLRPVFRFGEALFYYTEFDEGIPLLRIGGRKLAMNTTLAQNAEDIDRTYFAGINADGDILVDTVEGDTISLCCSDDLFINGSTEYRDPLSVILCLLLSKKGDGTNHATYDVLPEGMGLGWPSAWVDVTGIETLRDSTPIKDLHLQFVIPDGADAKKWLEENVLRPNMLFMVESWDGTVTVKRLVARNEAIYKGSDLDITESMLLELPTFDINNFPIGEISWKYNWDPGEDKYYAELKTIFQESIRRYGSNARRYELECQTCYNSTRELSGGRTMSASDSSNMPMMIGEYTATMFERFASNPMPTLSIELPYNRMTSVGPGSIVRVSSSTTPNMRASARGLVGEWFQVVEAQPNPKTSSVKLLLWQIGVHDNNSARYAPSARLKSKTDNPGGKCELVCYTCYYTMAAFGGDVHQFAADDKVRFYTQNYVSLDSRTYTIDRDRVALENEVILSEPSLKFSVTSGYIMEAANYDECTTTQTTAWGYQSGTDSRLGAGGTEGNQYD